ncbi:methyl-accepting chemotaxis protein [Tolypothrix sp. FACHB-123]|uniref:methyl-accepting chemotaxis protein n=1 Tax=Tolypothrix sp. FACHB-123 TaxID=2692868 RepID=UPI001685D678|nr:methyl-accepting chemotaxis protein [Tolypothrix sp. FACHB-123]MBD2358612.1 methyl-accepting chemotaxis protein [Tolypothrix sp. FACHB-123]
MTLNPLRSLMAHSENSKTSRNLFKTQQLINQWGKALSLSILSLPKSLPRKVTLLAVAIGVIPIATVGSMAYTLASRSITAQIFAEQESRIIGLRSGLSITINQFVEDAEAIAKSPLITDLQQLNTTISELPWQTNSQLSTPITSEQKVSTLDNFIETNNGKYDGVAIIDSTGKLLFQSHSSRSFKSHENYSEQKHFQRAFSTQSVAISDPKNTVSIGRSHLEVAAPIKHPGTGEVIGVVLLQMSSDHLGQIFKYIQDNSWEYQIVSPEGQIFAAAEADLIGNFAKDDYQGLTQPWSEILQHLKEKSVLTNVAIDKNDHEQVLVTFASMPGLKGVPEPGWVVGIARPTAETFAPLRTLRQILFMGMAIAALMVGIIAAILAKRATRSLRDATSVVEKMGLGTSHTRLTVEGEDELAVLCTTINNMAEQIQGFIQEKELLQTRVLELLVEVEPVSQGDLTIYANVTDDEVGTIADSYNYVIENLRKIVTQVKTATNQVEATANHSESLTKTLVKGAVQQSKKITAAIQHIQVMDRSIQAIATNAKAAEATVQQATATVEMENELMNLTVEGIGAIRETVAATTKKVKHLGESSQKIFTVVNLIKNFAEQTNVLALNASLEAARAGEQGRGFAIVADEIRELAQQSAKATDDIEKLISSIQRATSEVVTAMDVGTEQVVSGSKLVDETRLGLNQIVTANAQIYRVVEAIAQATVEQAQNSEIVTQAMAEVATIAQHTATSATNVSASFEKLIAVAKVLQGNVSQFKVH